MIRNRLKNKMDVIVCRHCRKKVTSPEVSNLTLICPHCKKSVNGQYYHRYVKLRKPWRGYNRIPDAE